ncbi:MAG: DUF4426 domain-containing protein [Candidatus Endonucleobacter bathymodioli]|uniref:DUF4426 domain-containing protein n=1 Tax=Candidatus Endonucleibacter bathymodioli TaxID=539814 RepID=A0AA90NLS6_9GAMM|nr:DUF4426 domain-containing protein [Candidatus Endonucleobacter bathymodioli]
MKFNRWLLVATFVVGFSCRGFGIIEGSVPDARELVNKPVDINGYQVHCSAFNSKFLSPGIATSYKLTRRSREGIINVAVRDTKISQVGTAASAKIKGRVANLLGQGVELNFQEVREDDAIYYLASFSFSNEDILTFTLDVQPEKSPRSGQVKFRQQFFSE